ncbi:MAG: YciI family protein [Solirubrobacteraceae bacterium]
MAEIERTDGTHYVVRLMPPRSTFPGDITDAERELMGAHAVYYETLMDTGKIVVYGPVRDSSGAWGLVVIEASNPEEVRELTGADPAVAGGLMAVELGSMPVTVVRR